MISILLNGGTNEVASGGMVGGTTVSGGGTLVVLQGGLDENPDGGFAVNGAILPAPTTVSSGGVVAVSSGGTTIGDEIASGGREVISSGGHATQDISLLGGTLEVASGGLADYVEFGAINGSVHWTSDGSTLVLDSAQSFHGTVAGFGNHFVPGQIDVPDQIDLVDIAFGTAGKKGPLSYDDNFLSGTLTVTDGVHTANIALIGQYTASEFAVSNDGHGGTLITYTADTTPIATGGGKGHHQV